MKRICSSPPGWGRTALTTVAIIAVAMGARPVTAGELLVADQNKIQVYDAQTGAMKDGFIPVGNYGMGSGGTTTGGTTTGTTTGGTGTGGGGGNGNGAPAPSGLANPMAMTFGPDGNLYVADYSNSAGQVLRFSALDGSFMGEFVPSGSGGLLNPVALTFGPDGNLYVASSSSASSSTGTQQVLRYDGITGAFIDAFVPAGSGGLRQVSGITFGPDGNLYVADFVGNQVLRYNGTTGAFIDAFVAAGSGGLREPWSLLFGPDANLYITSFGTNQVLRYNGSTGAFMTAFVAAGSGGLNLPRGMQFGPDGNLYVVSSTTSQVLSYNGSTGAFIGIFIPSTSLNQPFALAFTPPKAPKVVGISGVSPTQISLAWTLNSDDQTGVTVWRKGGGIPWTRIATLPAMSFSYSDSGLTPGVSYAYRVRTVNRYGISPWAVEPSATTIPLVPDSISTLAAWTAGPGTISLTWQGSGSGVVSSYLIIRKGGGADWAQIATVPGNVNSYVDTGLMGNTQYSYQVRAFGPIALSLIGSNVATAWTPLVPPATPTGLAATVASPTQINLTWAIPANSDETAVAVFRKNASGVFVRIAVLPPKSTSYSDTGLTTGTPCTYQVRTANDFYVSGWSSQVTATPQ